MRVRSSGAAFERGKRVAPALVLVSSVLGAACTLTTDLDGYAGLALSADAGDAALDGSSTPTGDAAVEAGDGGVVDYGAVVAADRPVSWWRFEDVATASVAKDSAGKNDATRSTSGVVFAARGVRGGAASFTGEGLLDVGDTLGFGGLVPFSIELWMKPSNGNAGQLLVKRDETNPGNFRGWVMYRGDDRSVHFEGWGADISAWTNGPIDTASSSSGFSHVVLVVSYDGGKGNASMWIDGVRQGPGGFDNVIALPTTTAPLYIGRGYTGLLDEVAVYDRALTAAQINAHLAAGR